MKTHRATSRHVVRLSPDRCYWAWIDGLPANASEEALRYGLEPWIPAELDEVEARFVRIGERFAACAVEHAVLNALLAAHSDRGLDVRSVRPGAWPDALRSTAGDADLSDDALARFEFRTGDYRCAGQRRLRRLTVIAAVLGVVASATLFSFGSFQRANALRSEAAAARNAEVRLIETILGLSRQAGLDPRLRLSAELRALERTQGSNTDLEPELDVRSHLVSLLACWPESVRTRVRAVQIDQQAVTLRGDVEEPADFEALRAAIEQADAPWSVRSGNSGRAREGASFSIALELDDVQENAR